MDNKKLVGRMISIDRAAALKEATGTCVEATVNRPRYSKKTLWDSASYKQLGEPYYGSPCRE